MVVIVAVEDFLTEMQKNITTFVFQILANQTRFSVIFTGADKSYLTYPYPTPGMNRK